MRLMKGDMLAAHKTSEIMLFTANSFITRDGRLVMGRGAAQQVRDAYPGIDRVFGHVIGGRDVYGVALHPAIGIGAFQVKRHFKDNAEIGLIAGSVDVLCGMLRGEWKGVQVHLNFPGIGNGGLKRSTVLPLLLRLPDDVSVWEFD